MDFSFLSAIPFFKGCSAADIEKMSHCLAMHRKEYKKGEAILLSGSLVKELGIVLSGKAEIQSIDLWGNKSVLSIVEPGEIFAEAYACLSNQPLLVDVFAEENCDILFVSTEKLFAPCQAPCASHKILIKNLLVICAAKNVALSNRMFDMSSKTIRGRLDSYFSRQITIQGSNDISIPFDRQQLADYLGIDRSALSKELGKMKSEGLLDFKKNHFKIYIDN
jgi:CRP-like cAMP-binding protein